MLAERQDAVVVPLIHVQVEFAVLLCLSSLRIFAIVTYCPNWACSPISNRFSLSSCCSMYLTLFGFVTLSPSVFLLPLPHCCGLVWDLQTLAKWSRSLRFWHFWPFAAHLAKCRSGATFPQFLQSCACRLQSAWYLLCGLCIPPMAFVFSSTSPPSNMLRRSALRVFWPQITLVATFGFTKSVNGLSVPVRSPTLIRFPTPFLRASFFLNNFFWSWSSFKFFMKRSLTSSCSQSLNLDSAANAGNTPWNCSNVAPSSCLLENNATLAIMMLLCIWNGTSS